MIAGMNTTLAIYDALIQAKVPADAARAVVDALIEGHDHAARY